MRRLILALALVLAMAGWGWATDLFVRPVTGAPYGDGSGSSYENAFGGLAAVVWGAGAGKVNPGDTLYLSGTFVGEFLIIGASGADAAHPTIYRGDPVGHPAGVIYGASLITTWTEDSGTDPIIWSSPVVSAQLWNVYVNERPAGAAVATAKTNITRVYNWYFAANVLYVGYDYDCDLIPNGVGAVINRRQINTNAKNYLKFMNLTVKQGYELFNCNSSVGVEITGCTFTQGAYGILFLATSSDINIHHNNFYNLENQCTGVIYTAAAAGTVSNVTIAYNKIINSQGTAIGHSSNQTGWLEYNNLVMNNRNGGLNNGTGTGDTVKNNIFWFNIPHELDSDSLDAHTNNAYYAGINPIVVDYNATAYKYDDLTTYEATAIASNPFPNLITVLNQPLQAAAIAADGTIYGGVDTKIIKSTDGGTTWGDCGTADLSFTSTKQIQIVQIDAAGNIYTSCRDTNAAKRGLWRSTNGGTNWTRVIDGTAWASGCSVWGFDQATDGTLYCSTYGTNESHIYTSTPASSGAAWTDLYDASALDLHVHQVVVDKSTGYIYFNTGDTNHVYYRSEDGGANFSQIMAQATQTAAIYAGSNYIVFGNDADGNGRIYRSVDNGDTFDFTYGSTNGGHYMNIGGDLANGYLLATYTASATGADKQSCIVLSTDHGVTWASILSMRVNTVDEGFYSVSKKAVNGKMIVTYAQEDGTWGNAYLVNINNWVSFLGTLPSSSPCLKTGVAIPGLTTDYFGVTVHDPPNIGISDTQYGGGGLIPSLGLSPGNRPPFGRRP